MWVILKTAAIYTIKKRHRLLQAPTLPATHYHFVTSYFTYEHAIYLWDTLKQFIRSGFAIFVAAHVQAHVQKCEGGESYIQNVNKGIYCKTYLFAMFMD